MCHTDTSTYGLWGRNQTFRGREIIPAVCGHKPEITRKREDLPVRIEKHANLET